jgi:hypothetical protein
VQISISRPSSSKFLSRLRPTKNCTENIRPEIFQCFSLVCAFMVLCAVCVCCCRFLCSIGAFLFFSPLQVFFFLLWNLSNTGSRRHPSIALTPGYRSIVARRVHISTTNNRHIGGKFIKLFPLPALGVCVSVCFGRSFPLFRRRHTREISPPFSAVFVLRLKVEGGEKRAKFLFIFNFRYLHLISTCTMYEKFSVCDAGALQIHLPKTHPTPPLASPKN